MHWLWSSKFLEMPQERKEYNTDTKHEITWEWRLARDHGKKIARDCEKELIPREFFFFTLRYLKFVSLVYMAGEPHPENKVQQQHPNLRRLKNCEQTCSQPTTSKFLRQICASCRTKLLGKNIAGPLQSDPLINNLNAEKIISYPKLARNPAVLRIFKNVCIVSAKKEQISWHEFIASLCILRLFF